MDPSGENEGGGREAQSTEAGGKREIIPQYELFWEPLNSTILSICPLIGLFPFPTMLQEKSH